MKIILRSGPFLAQHCFVFFVFGFTGEWLAEFAVPFFVGGGAKITLLRVQESLFLTSKFDIKQQQAQFRRSV